jgi:hypothetical protein
MLHLKLLGKQEQVKPKTSRRREKMKIRAETETKKIPKNQQQQRSWFFLKNKQD